MSIDQQTIDELKAEVEKVLASLSMREAQAFRMMMNMKLINQTAEQQWNILRAMLDELKVRSGS
jgi:antitoxin component of RelBE/YafQ-DinJ toxin-antitoxin module